MRKTLIALVATAATLALAPAAEARQGCGRDGHRGPYGQGYRGPTLVVGNFYAGHGYWDGRRYWQHRDRFHGGWRYR